MKTRWWIGYKAAEGDSYFPIELSEPEYNAIQKFIEAQKNAVGEPYSGGFGLLECCFDTKEQAEEFISEVYLD